MNLTNFFVEFPESKFTEFNCKNLSATLIYLNQSYKWEVIKVFDSSEFLISKGARRCRFNMDVDYLLA